MPQAQCETCGNQYDKAFQVVMANETHVFDSFECAIEALAPRCTHCGCRVIGHGVEQEGEIFCCSNCASVMGPTTLQDRA
jgi:Rieske Fe-S protein